MYNRFGFRGAVLLGAGLLYIIAGIALASTEDIRPPSAAQRIVIDWDFINMYVIGGMFIAAGVVGMIAAFARRPLRDRYGFAAILYVTVVWAMFYLMGVIYYHDTRAFIIRGLLNMTVWLIAAYVFWVIARWPEPNGHSDARS